MLNRRDVMKGTAAVLLAGQVRGQESSGPFREPTARFDRKKLESLPSFAFQRSLPIPLSPRPVMIGTYEELAAAGAQPFGPGDPVPIGGAYHGVAREWAETPSHWCAYGPPGTKPAVPGVESWRQKQELFGRVSVKGAKGGSIRNWGEFPIKCYKIPIVETTALLRPDTKDQRPARVYGYAGMVPGPMLALRLGQPVLVRYQNLLDTETSVHLHGGHNPSHSDGFPSFYILPGKSRDYFYPNILPLIQKRSADGRETYEPDVGESQSTMWYHDHAMDATAYNVSKGLAGFAKTFGELELALIHDRVLPGLGPDSCRDPERDKLETDPKVVKELEAPDYPGFYRYGKEPYHNPYDLPVVIQDKVIDLESGQIAYDNTGHNGYLGDTILINGAAWPKLEVENRKYRLRFLNGSNARFYRLRFLSESDFDRLMAQGAAAPGNAAPANPPSQYEGLAKPFLRIGKDSWMWPKAVTRTSVLLGMANRADVVVDFKKLAPDLKPGEQRVFYLVNTMPQADGRGPRGNLDDIGDPRVLPLPFDFNPPPDNPAGLEPIPLAELDKPMALMKIVVTGPPIRAEDDATIEEGTPLNPHDPIHDDEVVAVREFIFERGKGAWQINGRFYDPTIANATPTLGTAEEWVLRNGGGGWWHPIHIHLESHQLVAVLKDFVADDLVDIGDPPAVPTLGDLTDITRYIDQDDLRGLHDTMVLGPNTVVRIRLRFRTWNGPFVFHCHNLEHEDMRMMHNFEPVPRNPDSVPPPVNGANTSPNARTHGNDVTWRIPGQSPRMGELPWEYRPVPEDPVGDAGVNVVPPRSARP